MGNFADLQAALGLLDQGTGHLATARNKPPPFETIDDTVFLCIEVDPSKHDWSYITEIGIAVMDTRECEEVCPGPGGRNWFQFIDCRHLTIHENKHLLNRHNTTAGEHTFEVGTNENGASENKHLQDVQKGVQQVLSSPEIGEGFDEERNVVLVLFDAGQQLRLLNHLGVDMYDEPDIMFTAGVRGLCSGGNGRHIELSRLAKVLQLEHEDLLNAGNRADTIVQCLVRLTCFKTFNPKHFANILSGL
ncbi:putative nucleic acid binding protein 13 [Elsinoe australis]|uniref:Putative nucleic acid binding protein 13 n=1 Tax=Elsinoe australis TaxID=40998 RepID=A0A4U7B7Q0_9PEZI|nr:putative nucleic acid binding protein 13 [Elsinoe australis]